MNRAWIVFKKECMENMRDRRTLLNSLVFGPLFGPLLFVVLLSVVMSRATDRAERVLELPVVGAENAPNLIEFLRQRDVDIKVAPADPEQAVRDQDEDMVLRIPADFAEQWREGKPAQVELIHDDSRQFTATSVRRLTRLLEGYGDMHAAMRLTVRGLNPELIQPVAIVSRDQSSAESRAGMLLSFLPYILILGAFLGGMYLAIDTTAGERERQSLEALLINPVPRSQILAGKLMATTAFALVALALSLIGLMLFLPFIPTKSLGFSISLNSSTALMAMLTITPVALLAGSSQTLVAAFSKSFREAQTWLSMLMLIPALPSLMMAVLQIKPQAWMYATPLLSQNVIITHLVRGETVLPWQYAAGFATTLLLGLLLSWLAVVMYNREHLAISA